MPDHGISNRAITFANERRIIRILLEACSEITAIEMFAFRWDVPVRDKIVG